MEWMHSKWFNITCWCLMALSIIGLVVNGITAQDVGDFIGLVFSAISAIALIVIFIKGKVTESKLKERKEKR